MSQWSGGGDGRGFVENGLQALGREGGSEDVDAGAAVGGVEDQAGEGVGVVGKAGALVGRRRLRGGDGRACRGRGGGKCLVFAGGEGGDAEGIELKPEAIGEGEGDVFFGDLV